MHRNIIAITRGMALKTIKAYLDLMKWEEVLLVLL